MWPQEAVALGEVLKAAAAVVFIIPQFTSSLNVISESNHH